MNFWIMFPHFSVSRHTLGLDYNFKFCSEEKSEEKLSQINNNVNEREKFCNCVTIQRIEGKNGWCICLWRQKKQRNIGRWILQWILFTSLLAP